MKEISIQEACYFLPKSSIKAGEGKKEGQYPFFTSSENQTLWVDDFLFDDECLIIGTGGSASCNYYNGKFSVSTDNIVVKFDCNYSAMRYWALQYGPYVEVLSPKGLREQLREDIINMAEKYSLEV